MYRNDWSSLSLRAREQQIREQRIRENLYNIEMARYGYTPGLRRLGSFYSNGAYGSGSFYGGSIYERSVYGANLYGDPYLRSRMSLPFSMIGYDTGGYRSSLLGSRAIGLSSGIGTDYACRTRGRPGGFVESCSPSLTRAKSWSATARLRY
ncbi:hypothetical protein O181_062386 [Austropuccinia psidii MF-1]|uniref:Uncharacterized protein n=1 Tax=Austropuccinia psidii MF-1 TaxID=1389203 RepID=A0A9Q3HYE0_9BASI|nr:hypothetical protein [Austropuccinia psidii MF-1]